MGHALVNSAGRVNNNSRRPVSIKIIDKGPCAGRLGRGVGTRGNAARLARGAREPRTDTVPAFVAPAAPQEKQTTRSQGSKPPA
ncbi:unnamed protein product [Pieris brassicae]|uniref:Uncharacterized protein n=1 Tax=Pieris brassicae TaxID=7116 RepID=A0A9P0TAL1_PIEBR|nr:unnamed protein product [Pieris brassicae]